MIRMNQDEVKVAGCHLMHVGACFRFGFIIIGETGQGAYSSELSSIQEWYCPHLCLQDKSNTGLMMVVVVMVMLVISMTMTMTMTMTVGGGDGGGGGGGQTEIWTSSSSFVAALPFSLGSSSSSGGQLWLVMLVFNASQKPRTFWTGPRVADAC